MKKFSMTCTCGDVMNVEASTRTAAVNKLKKIMNEGAVKQHMADKHPGQAVPAVAQVHADIAQQVKEA